MKAGLTTSAFVHVAAIAFGVVSLAAPKPLSVPDVEAVTADIVPYAELTKTIKGDKKADRAEKPAPKPTEKPQEVVNAQNIGDTKNDLNANAPKAEKTPPVEKVEVPTPKPSPAPAKEPTPVPTPKLAPEPKPKTDIALLAKQSEIPEPSEPEEETFEKLPEKVAAPKPRPAQPKPEAAQTDKRKLEDAVKTADTKKTDTEKTTDAKKKAVINKAKTSAGGAKKSTKKAALGAKKANNATKLSQNELDALRGALEGCFNAGDLPGHKDAATMRAKVTFKLNRSGEIEGRVKAKVSGTSGSTRSVFARRVKNAVTECSPYNLPPEKYDTWSEVVVNFSLTDLL